MLLGALVVTTNYQTIPVLADKRREKCKIVICNVGLEDDYLSLFAQDTDNFPDGINLYQNFPILAGDTQTSQFELSLNNVTVLQAKSRRGILNIAIVN